MLREREESGHGRVGRRRQQDPLRREREGRVGAHEWGGTDRRDPLRRERGESGHAQGGPVRSKGRGGWVSKLLSFFLLFLNSLLFSLFPLNPNFKHTTNSKEITTNICITQGQKFGVQHDATPHRYFKVLSLEKVQLQLRH